MVKYHGTHRCGHPYTANLYGSMSDHPRQLAAKDAGRCDECAYAVKVADAAVATAGLPALVGSEKQVAWATTIRAEVLGKMETTLDESRTGVETGRFGAMGANGCIKAVVLYPLAMDELAAQTSAKWWIDHRHEPVSGLGKLLPAVAAEGERATAAMVAAAAAIKAAHPSDKAAQAQAYVAAALAGREAAA